jgi:hypothetical protein
MNERPAAHGLDIFPARLSVRLDRLVDRLVDWLMDALADNPLERAAVLAVLAWLAMWSIFFVVGDL